MVAKGDAEEPDMAPNFELPNKLDPLEPEPNRGLPPAADVANGDFVDVLANPLPGGSYCTVVIN